MFPKIDVTEKDKKVCEDRKGQESLVSLRHLSAEKFERFNTPADLIVTISLTNSRAGSVGGTKGQFLL